MLALLPQSMLLLPPLQMLPLLPGRHQQTGGAMLLPPLAALGCRQDPGGQACLVQQALLPLALRLGPCLLRG